MSQPQQRRFMLPESELPTHFYNIAADLPEPAPPVLHPGTREPIGPADLAPLFPMELIKQEVSTERFIEIPEPVREAYRIYRPSPLIRALGLERALDTPHDDAVLVADLRAAEHRLTEMVVHGRIRAS